MQDIQYMIGPNNLTFYDEDDQLYSLRSDHPNFPTVRTLLVTGAATIDRLVELADVVRGVQTQIDSAIAGRYLKEGVVHVDTSGVYYNGEKVDTSLTTRMLNILSESYGYASAIRPWVTFMGKLYSNPNHTTRFELYDWLNNCNLPLTDDGDFIAYKRVRDDYKDVHSGSFDNSVGTVVQLENRTKVDPVRTNTCSRGLHFCSAGYLPSFSGPRVMLLKINPADVVSIPTDYNFTKGRTWKYKVVGETNLTDALESNWPAVVSERHYRINNPARESVYA